MAWGLRNQVLMEGRAWETGPGLPRTVFSVPRVQGLQGGVAACSGTGRLDRKTE